MKSADESRQITKARRKLKKRMEIIDRQFTDSALEEVVERMHSLIEPEAKHTQKTARESNESAKLSQSVNRLREQLVKQMEEEHHQMMALNGRVSVRKQNDLPKNAHP
jgi:hypothetical protein